VVVFPSTTKVSVHFLQILFQHKILSSVSKQLSTKIPSSHSLTLSLSHSLLHFPSHHAQSLSLSHTLSRSLTLYPSPSLLLSLSHSLILSLSLSHTLFHSFTLSTHPKLAHVAALCAAHDSSPLRQRPPAPSTSCRRQTVGSPSCGHVSPHNPTLPCI
jgi:hypothetical protein